MREATSRLERPDLRIAHAVRATPPAPAVANRRVAAWPARVISVLARIPMRSRDPRPIAPARQSTRGPRAAGDGGGGEEHDVAEEGEGLEAGGGDEPPGVRAADAVQGLGHVAE